MYNIDLKAFKRRKNDLKTVESYNNQENGMVTNLDKHIDWRAKDDIL